MGGLQYNSPSSGQDDTTEESYVKLPSPNPPDASLPLCYSSHKIDSHVGQRSGCFGHRLPAYPRRQQTRSRRRVTNSHRISSWPVQLYTVRSIPLSACKARRRTPIAERTFKNNDAAPPDQASNQNVKELVFTADNNLLES